MIFAAIVLKEPKSGNHNFYTVKNFLIKLLSSAISVLFAEYLLSSGVHMKHENLLYAIMLAAVLGFLNSVVKPILVLLTLPATVFSLGLFLLVINAAMIMLADYLLIDFTVDSFWWALIFSLVVSLISSIIEAVLRKDKILKDQKEAS